ncbi:MAG: glycosyltransferase family 2 protein [Acidimicrobiaceae bacterium]|nr:glycosyltransferase family 2 protein [Acidimicrobiaceae bacterium]
MESRAPAVVAVVVTTGSGPGLEATVASLAAQNYEELSLLVVANGEAEHVPARVAPVAPNAFVRILEDNRGFGAACNEASLMVVGAAFFLFCHDDVRLEPDVVQLLVEAAFRTNAGIVSPKVVAYEDPMVLLHVGQTCDRFAVVHERCELGEIDHGQQDLERDVFVAPGGVTLVRTDLFRTLRGFDPVIPVLGEDLDLCWRAQIAGARIIVAPQAKVAHRGTIASGERPISAAGTRRSSRQDLQRRHQLLVVASGWGRLNTLGTLVMLALLDTMELLLAVLGRDHDRVVAILGSWRWAFAQRKVIRERRRLCNELRVLSDSDLRRLQVGGASRVKRFFFTLLRDGLDRARGMLPVQEHHVGVQDYEIDGVGFAAAFSEEEEFDEIPESPALEMRTRPSRFLTSFRTQAAVVVTVVVLWLVGSRNLVAMHLPLIGRLAPLDSWWSMWRHFFASWSPGGVGSGTPGMPGYGVLGFAGTFVLGRMGMLPRLALIASVPFGALGVSRMLRSRVSNRARIVASVAYLAMPAGINMISAGRVDVLLVVAFAPFIVRRIFELMDVPGFRLRPYSDPVPFGQRGWRTSEAGQRMVVVMLIAVVSAMAPATLVVVALVVVGIVVARAFEPDDDVAFRGSGRLLGSLIFNVAIFLLPLSVDVVLAGRRALEVFGLSRGPWSAPTFVDLLRGVDGSFGAGWIGWLLPGAGVLGLLLCRAQRRLVASKVATIATLTLTLAVADAHHWMGSFAPDLDVLLVLYTVMMVTLIGLGVSALENDLRQAGFGWRQASAGLMIVSLLVAIVPFAATFASGRFDLPTTSVAESLSTLSPSSYGGYRVLWIGDPSVVPLAGWSVAPGVEVATSTNGLPGGDSLFVAPDSGTSDVLMTAVRLALQGRTVRLGQLLAPAGISTIVVMNASAPEVPGVQSVPIRPVPSALLTELDRQTDLSLVLQTKSVEVYSNALFHGLVAQVPVGSNLFKPLFANGTTTGALVPGSTVVAGLAPAGAFTLDVNGRASAMSTQGSWTPFYKVSSQSSSVSGSLVLHRFPLNGLLALFTLSLWTIVWLGFGWIERLEWLFTGRRRDRAVAKHRKVKVDA